MTTNTIAIRQPSPFTATSEELIQNFQKAVSLYKQNPYHIARLVKTLGKKMHIKFPTTIRVALMTLIKLACNPLSPRHAKLRSALNCSTLR